MTKRLLALLCVSALSVTIITAPLFGQAFYGSLVGSVIDQSGAAVTGAVVTLINTGTQERHQGTTGTDGGYQFLNVVPALIG